MLCLTHVGSKAGNLKQMQVILNDIFYAGKFSYIPEFFIFYKISHSLLFNSDGVLHIFGVFNEAMLVLSCNRLS